MSINSSEYRVTITLLYKSSKSLLLHIQREREIQFKNNPHNSLSLNKQVLLKLKLVHISSQHPRKLNSKNSKIS